MSLPEIFITPGGLFEPEVDGAAPGTGCPGVGAGFCPGPVWAAAQTVNVAIITIAEIVFRMVLSRRFAEAYHEDHDSGIDSLFALEQPSDSVGCEHVRRST